MAAPRSASPVASAGGAGSATFTGPHDSGPPTAVHRPLPATSPRQRQPISPFGHAFRNTAARSGQTASATCDRARGAPTVSS